MYLRTMFVVTEPIWNCSQNKPYYLPQSYTQKVCILHSLQYLCPSIHTFSHNRPYSHTHITPNTKSHTHTHLWRWAIVLRWSKRNIWFISPKRSLPSGKLLVWLKRLMNIGPRIRSASDGPMSVICNDVMYRDIDLYVK